MLKKNFNIQVLSIILLFLYGCGAISYHKKNVDFCASLIAEKRESYKIKYMGNTKDDLLKDFGKPSVRYDVYSHGIKYEEEWSYKTSGGWLGSDCAGVVWFYISDNKVQSIDVF